MPSLVVIDPLVLEKRMKCDNVFSLFRYYLPFRKDLTLYMNKLNSSSPKDALCQVRLKLAHAVVVEKKIKFRQCIYTFLLLSSLRKVPFTQKCILPSLVEIGPVVLEKKTF